MITQPDSVSFFTCCYEADWEFFLKEDRLKEMIERCNYTFASKNLVINNVEDRNEVTQYADLAIKKGIIDNYFFSEDYIDGTLNRVSLKRRDFKLDGFDGYVYSVAPLTAAVLCNTDHLLYFMGDCILNKKYSFDWITKGIEKLRQDTVFCVIPFWTYYDGREGFLNEDELCYYDHGFSDQVFLTKTQNLLSVDYKEYNIKSEVFPIYGGNHFERRIFCFINNHQLFRCIFKEIVYTHEKLLKPEYSNVSNSTMKNKIKYFAARIKKKLREKNILVKYLLR